jgi:hypothetical protein
MDVEVRMPEIKAWNQKHSIYFITKPQNHENYTLRLPFKIEKSYDLTFDYYQWFSWIVLTFDYYQWFSWIVLTFDYYQWFSWIVFHVH